MSPQRWPAKLCPASTGIVMRIGIVSETYPPEINGVALTVHSLAAGLVARLCTVSATPYH